MAGIFRRMFKVGEAEAHAVIDKLEDPIKMTEQGIRDLKKDLQSAMKSLAEVKATAIRLKKDGEDQKKLASDYERKAMLLLQKMQNGELDQNEAERLATEALSKKDEALTNSERLLTEHKQIQQTADQLQVKVGKLKQSITGYENNLVTLKARARTASSMRKINQQMSKVDSSGTIVMLEKMKNKVEEEESLAEAYKDIADASLGIDEEINKAIETSSSAKATHSLSELKKKMGIEG
ncbi:MAG: PspA/IM30 family protein [Spirochaetota bacterium]|nr:PspA/IM30 family protein [Spirochaetota bacterium]